jgi:hypothetical protein
VVSDDGAESDGCWLFALPAWKVELMLIFLGLRRTFEVESGRLQESVDTDRWSNVAVARGRSRSCYVVIKVGVGGDSAC